MVCRTIPILATAAALAAAALPVQGCYYTGVDLPGNDVDKLETVVPTVEVCQRNCQGHTECEYWTYNTVTLACHLKSAAAEGTSVPAEGVISGPKICPIAKTCYEEGVDLAGGDLFSTSVINPRACQYQCQSVNGCVFWTFVYETSMCYMKDDKGVPTPKDGVISGPRECDDQLEPTACEYDTDFWGNDIQKFEGNIPSAAECQNMCKAFNNCFFFTYVGETSSCYVKDSDEGRVYKANAISGHRNCTLGNNELFPSSSTTTTTTTTTQPLSCFRTDVDYFGSDVAAFGLGAVTSATNCQKLCALTIECIHFTYYQGTCYFKNAEAPKNAVAKEGAVSGPKQCSTETSTAQPIAVLPALRKGF